MFGLGFSELLLVLLVALLVFGPKKLPEVARNLGRTMGMFRRTLDELKRDIALDELEDGFRHGAFLDHEDAHRGVKADTTGRERSAERQPPTAPPDAHES